MLYSQGIALEDLGVPSQDGTPVESDHRRIWQQFAEHFYLFRGTPTGLWLAAELAELRRSVDAEQEADGREAGELRRRRVDHGYLDVLADDLDDEGLAALYRGCDVLVHPYRGEGFAMPVLEAMACGLPVVGVAAGGVAESVDEEVGQLAVASEPAAFAEAIEALFARDVAAVGMAARRRAAERHGWDAVFRQLCAIYGGLTGRRAFGGLAQLRDH